VCGEGGCEGGLREGCLPFPQVPLVSFLSIMSCADRYFQRILLRQSRHWRGPWKRRVRLRMRRRTKSSRVNGDPTNSLINDFSLL
jgi:hypothetical protein